MVEAYTAAIQLFQPTHCHGPPRQRPPALKEPQLALEDATQAIWRQWYPPVLDGHARGRLPPGIGLGAARDAEALGLFSLGGAARQSKQKPPKEGLTKLLRRLAKDAKDDEAHQRGSTPLSAVL